mmetsp:Transcript_36809/g.65914  ORF Transcript_36809/g.65914 Transcript_36809/m.65914 type:complete len:212 (+) Transcript_36809:633-1268(+)
MRSAGMTVGPLFFRSLGSAHWRSGWGMRQSRWRSTPTPPLAASSTPALATSRRWWSRCMRSRRGCCVWCSSHCSARSCPTCCSSSAAPSSLAASASKSNALQRKASSQARGCSCSASLRSCCPTCCTPPTLSLTVPLTTSVSPASAVLCCWACTAPTFIFSSSATGSCTSLRTWRAEMVKMRRRRPCWGFGVPSPGSPSSRSLSPFSRTTW